MGRGALTSLKLKRVINVVSRAGPAPKTKILKQTARARVGRAKNKNIRQATDIFSGGAEETRTPYLGNANAALYQVSYSPVSILYTI